MKGGKAQAPKGGVGVLTPDGFAWLDRSAGGGAVVALAPSEQAAVLAVDLPLPSRRKRAAAAPFAVEGRIAEPLAVVDVVLGPEIAPRRHLVAVVRRAVLEGWTKALADAGAPDARIVPDYLTLPRPEEGAWAASFEAGRALVHAGDGTGFALAAEAFPIAWMTQGRPRLVVYAGAPAPEIPFTRGECDPLAAAAATGFDLRGDARSSDVSALGAGARALAAVLAVGVVGHLGLAAAETVALRSEAKARRAEAAALLAEIAPQAPIGGDAAEALAAYAPRGGGADPAFLALFSRASAALAPFKDGLAMRSLAFDGQARTLEMALEAPDLGALQRIEAALAQAGLAPESGAAALERGAAEQRFVVRDRRTGAAP